MHPWTDVVIEVPGEAGLGADDDLLDEPQLQERGNLSDRRPGGAMRFPGEGGIGDPANPLGIHTVRQFGGDEEGIAPQTGRIAADGGDNLGGHASPRFRGDGAAY